MKRTLAQARSFDRSVQLLFVNQLTINTGFYMLMPYLANHLSGRLGLAAWMVGLVLGVRNFSQQGMFLLGGTLADRLGYKPMILAGLALRTAGFALLGFSSSLPVLVVASAMTGLAGALFNPAVRAYVAVAAGERKVEAFSVFNVFYQLGIVLGPLIGLALTGISFQLMCAVAAGLFTILAVLQARALPARHGERGDPGNSVLRDWRQIVANRAFGLFSVVMIGSYVLNFQVYLGLPLEVRRVTGGELGVTALFVVSGALAVAGQVRVTDWAKSRWTSSQAIVRGLAMMGVAFVPLALAGQLMPPVGPVLAMVPILVSTVLLTLGVMVVYPFEMATIVRLAGERNVGMYYGFYSTLSGIGIAVGNLLAGAAFDLGRSLGVPALPWLLLVAVGGGCALTLFALDRSGRLDMAADEGRQSLTAAS